MALNIKDAETERLAREVAAMTGDSKTGAIRTALRERRQRLELAGPAEGDRERALMAWLEGSVWCELPPGARGHAPTHEEQEALLGYAEPDR
jgi:antitoxin VapB